MLQVLPHAGGGGETYVRALARIEGYHSERIVLAQLPWRMFAHDVVHVHGEVAAGLCLPVLALRRSVVTLHGLHFLRRFSGAQRRLAVANLRLVLGAAARAICVARTEHAELVDTVGAHAARRAVVIRNGVDPAPLPTAAEKAALRTELGIPADATVAAFVASLDSVKDPLTAVRAAKAAGVTLLVIGDGPLRPQLEALGGAMLLGQRTDVRRLLAAADIFFLPSQREGLSFALLEAMALGLAPVVSEAPGNSETVGEAGIVARFGDAANFAAALSHLRDNPSFRSQLGAKARERVQREFSAERMLNETRAVYEEVLGR